MAAIVWADVTAHAPGDARLATYTNTQGQTDILEFVNTTTNVSLLDTETGIKTRLARIYMAAHLATMELRRGVAGIMSGETAGPLSRQYMLLQGMTRSELSLTSYGLNYLAIIKRSAARGGMVL